MKPITFPEVNRILTGKKDKDGKALDDIIDLPTHTNSQRVVSHWEMSEDERHQFMQTGELWVWFFAGAYQPGVHLSALSPGPHVESVSLQVLWHDEKSSLSKWKFNEDETALISTTGRFWIAVFGGFTQPPIWFDTLSPFVNVTPTDHEAQNR